MAIDSNNKIKTFERLLELKSANVIYIGLYILLEVNNMP